MEQAVWIFDMKGSFPLVVCNNFKSISYMLTLEAHVLYRAYK